MSELPAYPGTPLASGMENIHVRYVQELLTFHHIQTQIDSDFGPQTKRNVEQFQAANGLNVTGTVEQATWDALWAPLAGVLRPITPAPANIRDAILAYARQHFAAAPREIGGENRGPWVRLYTSGHDGTEWRWCAGFATFVARQAFQAMGLPMTVARTLSCDELATHAKAHGRFISNSQVIAQPSLVQPGDLFLRLDKPNDWGHTGIVESVSTADFITIEGNADPAGSSNGYTVCSLRRSFARMDFIRVA